MSLLTVDDSDPLLAFDQERGAADSSAPPLEPVVQPIAAKEDRAPIQQPSQSASALTAKIKSLERALDQSKKQVAAMQSEMATLVRTVADIRKQRGRIVSKTPPLKPAARISSALAGLVLGIMLGVGGWLYFAGNDDMAIASPSPAPVAAAPQSDTRGLAPTVTSTPARYDQGLAPTIASGSERYDRGLAPKVASTPARYERGQPPNIAQRSNVAPAPARYDRGQAPDVVPVKYVGTLSIDADPGGEVSVDHQRAGPTPLRLTNLRAGSHLIWIERDGYRRFTRVVQVQADRVSRLSAELEPIAR